MKIGDLVELSTYGNARQHNGLAHGGYGIVTDITTEVGGRGDFPIKALWWKVDGESVSIWFHRRELKRFKRT